MSTAVTDPRSPRRYHPLAQLVLARLREFYREPEAVFWVYGFPILMVVALGIAFRNKPVERITVDVEQGPLAREIVAALGKDARLVAQVFDAGTCRLRLRTGKTDVVVAASRGNGGLRDGDGAAEAVSQPSSAMRRYAYRYDPTRPQSLLARNAVDDVLQRAAGRQDAAAVTDHELAETGGRYIDFLVPGLLGMSLMGGGLWGVGFVAVDMRIRKLLKRFLATPMKKRDFLLGVMVSRLVFMVPEVLVLLAFARIAFGVVNHGSLGAVVVVILLGAFTFAGIGLLVASRARTIEAVSGLMNLVMLPMWMLSGIFFSSDRFPDAIQPLIKALPLTPLNDALRAIMLEGAGLASQGLRLGILAAWGLVAFVLALRWFRWS